MYYLSRVHKQELRIHHWPTRTSPARLFSMSFPRSFWASSTDAQLFAITMHYNETRADWNRECTSSFDKDASFHDQLRRHRNHACSVAMMHDTFVTGHIAVNRATKRQQRQVKPSSGHDAGMMHDRSCAALRRCLPFIRALHGLSQGPRHITPRYSVSARVRHDQQFWREPVRKVVFIASCLSIRSKLYLPLRYALASSLSIDPSSV